MGVAAGAAHTAERLRAPAEDHSILASAARLAAEAAAVAETESAVPQSASLTGPAKPGMGDLVGITSVAASTTPAGADHCRPRLDLAAQPGAMIHLSLSAPCNRAERVIVRHSGLSFSVKTQQDGTASLSLPALKSDATVVVYFKDSRLVLGRVAVSDAAAYTRFAVVWEQPADLELRVTDGDKVLVGSPSANRHADQQVIALGNPSVQSPVLAQVYSVPGQTLGTAVITGELRITPASCGRTLRVETVHSARGISVAAEQPITVPLCGTSGDIMVLKNLAPAMTLAAPK